VEVEAAVLEGICCICVAVGMARVGEGMTIVAVGLTGVAGDGMAISVFVGTVTVFVGIDVCSGWILTSNCPQALRNTSRRGVRSFFNFIGFSILIFGLFLL
jgi:hypothetical protein